MAKRSFFERLTGTVSVEEYEPEEERVPADRRDVAEAGENGWMEEEAPEGQLAVDVYETPSHIIVRTMVAGIKPDDLDIAITRDMVTIKGKRERHIESGGGNFFHQELYWGSFTRTILLPQEVEVEEAEASEKHGLLTIRLPKVDKGRQTKLKVRSN